MPFPFRVVSALALMLLPGCGGEAVDQEEKPILERWVLGDPMLELGSMDGGPDSFSRIRGVALSPAGNLHVLLPQEQGIKVFGPSGDFVGTIGRQGQGPAEFSYPTGLGFVADTLWVLDAGADRMSFFHGGEFLTSKPYGEIPHFHPDRQPEIRAVVTGNRPVYVSSGRRMDNPLITETPVPLVLGNNGSFDTLAFTNMDHVGGFITQTTGGMLEAVRPFVQPFQDHDLLTVAPDGSTLLLVNRKASAQRSEALVRVQRIGLDGDVVCSANLPYEPTAIPPAHLDSIVDRLAGDAFSRDEAEEALFVPSHFPPVGRVVAGQDGTIWLDFRPAPENGNRWIILNQDCQPLAEMVISGNGVIRIADSNYVWLLTTGGYDVPYLTRHGVRRGLRER